MLRRPALSFIGALVLVCALGTPASAKTARLGPDYNRMDRVVNGRALSLNWSGYALLGRFSYVGGTFTVPHCKGNGWASEWAGIDGFNNQDLIQAGVSENGGAGYCFVQAWWEILPAASENIFWMKVKPGDVVSVDILRTSKRTRFLAASWTVNILNDTTGQDFTQSFGYNGPSTSAEWVVEAPEVWGAITPILPNSPATVWTGLRAFGHAGILVPVWLVQGGWVQEVPSSVVNARDLMQNGFQDEYIG